MSTPTPPSAPFVRAADTLLDNLLDLTVAPGYTNVGLSLRRHLPGWPPDPEPHALRGRRAVVTGASSGLGIATAQGLAALGASLHLVVRNTAKGERAARQVVAAVPGAEVSVDRCDLGDLDDVRRYCRELDARLGEGGPEGRGDAGVDLLVHNAGALPATRSESAQGHELTMTLHVLAPVLMTELLRPWLAGRDARVVLVSSGGMYAQALRADDPDYLTGEYAGTTAYARSKRAQVELVQRMAERWRDEGVGVHAMHPGWADTPGVVESLPRFHRITGPVLRDAAGGADTTVWLCGTQPSPEPGQFWHDRRARSAHFLGRHRPSTGEVDAMWRWVLDTLGL